jgi:large subunit ribosomal protein L21
MEPMRLVRMYAVIKTGGKQYRVEKGQTLNVERLGESDKVELTPVLLVDGDTVLATPSDLRGAKVSAKVVGESKGPKITGFTYKNKTNQRRRWGHRQHYSMIEITGISKGRSSKSSTASETEG